MLRHSRERGNYEELHHETVGCPSPLPQSGILAALSVHAAEPAKPVRMGSGVMTFDTVPGWGLLPDGNSALGPTHGAS